MFRKYQNVFRSRWKAVMWSMGVLLTAYCTVPSKDAESDGEDMAAVAAILGNVAGSPAQAEHHHVNPWALPPKTPSETQP